MAGCRVCQGETSLGVEWVKHHGLSAARDSKDLPACSSCQWSWSHSRSWDTSWTLLHSTSETGHRPASWNQTESKVAHHYWEPQLSVLVIHIVIHARSYISTCIRLATLHALLSVWMLVIRILNDQVHTNWDQIRSSLANQSAIPVTHMENWQTSGQVKTGEGFEILINFLINWLL